MKVTLDTDVINKSALSFPEFLLLLFIRQGNSIKDVLFSLQNKGAVVDNFDDYLITQHYSDELDSILLSSDSTIPKDDALLPLAEKLMAVMPQCKKEDTPYYFKCNKREVVLNLKKFCKLYGYYSDEDIINATRRYVDSFNGNYKLMKLLKYFIMKDEKKVNSEGVGYIEESSMLATLLENKDADSGLSQIESGELI